MNIKLTIWGKIVLLKGKKKSKRKAGKETNSYLIQISIKTLLYARYCVLIFI